jgi:hypothetical protein
VINISNSTSEDKSPWRPVQPGRPTDLAQAPANSPAIAAERAGARSVTVRLWRVLVTIAAVMLGWPAAIPRRLGDRLFTVNDTEAYWRGWQITKVQGGLGRRYRDPLFDTLAECSKCRGAGVNAKAPCVPCLGTGRITIDEVS